MTKIKLAHGKFLAILFMLMAIYNQIDGDKLWANIDFFLAAIVSAIAHYHFVKLLKGE